MPTQSLASRQMDSEAVMLWKKPRVIELCLALEINCYANAKA